MPAKTHKEFRSLVCLVCWKKQSPTNIRNIVGAVLEKIQAIPKFATYVPSEKLPSDCCGRCHNILVKIKKRQKTVSDLDIDFDLDNLSFPISTPHQLRVNGVTSIDDLTNCECTICKIGRKNGLETQKGLHQMGRPKLPGPAVLPDRVPVVNGK